MCKKAILAVLAASFLVTGCGNTSGSGQPGPFPAVNDSFVDPSAQADGPLSLGRLVYVAPFAQMLLGGGGLSIGHGSDVQDNVMIDSAPDRQVILGELVIVAHGATILGPARLGASEDDPCFVGFNALVDGANLEPGSMVGIMARLGPGITLRRGFKVLPGRNITLQAQADDPALGKVEAVTEADHTFMEGVLHVNQDLAAGYSFLRSSPSNISGIGPDPRSALHPQQSFPTLAGIPTQFPVFRNRIIGEVHMRDSLEALTAKMGQRDSIRADEGGPFHLGTLGRMEDEVTLHALEHSEISVGNGCTFGRHVLIHGGEDRANRPPERTQLGNNVSVAAGAVVFRSTLGDGCQIGERAVLDGCSLPAGTVVPAGKILIKNQDMGQVEW